MTGPATAFHTALNGRFEGILTWAAFDALWARLRAASEGWHVYDTAGDPPETPAAPAAFVAALQQVEAMFVHARSRSWCGAVYVDDRHDPGLVKVFDPHGMSACGGGGATRPRYILSRIPPAPLRAGPELRTKRGWFTRRPG